VKEIKFCTRAPYNITHCAFLVTLRTGIQYVVDPTGIQFGPRWPLVSAYRRYEVQYIHQTPEIANVRIRDLGRNSEVYERRLPDDDY
jgi:hypothetical protein